VCRNIHMNTEGVGMTGRTIPEGRGLVSSIPYAP
jgi:hypothetical protein